MTPETTPETNPETPAVVGRICLKDPGFMVQMGSRSTVQAAAEKWLRYGEYLTLEFLSDGTARVVPVAEQN